MSEVLFGGYFVVLFVLIGIGDAMDGMGDFRRREAIPLVLAWFIGVWQGGGFTVLLFLFL